MEDEEFSIAILKFTHIGFNSMFPNFLDIEFEIGTVNRKEKISLTNNIYFKACDSYGVIHHLKLLHTYYTLFITSSELVDKLNKYKDSEIKQNKYYSGNWVIEIVKTFKEYNIYFIRSIETDNNLNLDFYKIFKGIYSNKSEDKEHIKQYILLNIPSDLSLLVEIEKISVSISSLKTQTDIMFGKFRFSNIEGFTFIFHLEDLLDMYSKHGFKKSIYFEHNNKTFPVPSLPHIDSPLFYGLPAIDVYSGFITRSHILSIFISSCNTIKILDHDFPYDSFDEDKLLSIYEPNTLLGFGPYIEDDEKDNIHSKYLIYPNYHEESTNDFFNELPDYDTHVNEIQRNISMHNDLNEVEDNVYPPYWDQLDIDQKYGENDILAAAEYENDDRDYSSDQNY